MNTLEYADIRANVPHHALHYVPERIVDAMPVGNVLEVFHVQREVVLRFLLIEKAVEYRFGAPTY